MDQSPHAARDAGGGIWRIGDPFFRFWFRPVFPNRSRLVAARGLRFGMPEERVEALSLAYTAAVLTAL